MRRRSSIEVFLCCAGLAMLAMACGGNTPRGKPEALSFDAGPPPRPLFYQSDGLTWGMTPEEAIAAWGPPAENRIDADRLVYRDRAGFREANLYFLPVRREPDGTSLHLFSVYLQPGVSDDKYIKPKSAVRPDLVSRFGEPITDPKIYESQGKDMKTAEIFRAAECTLAVAQWARAEPQVNWPERLDSLSYTIVPTSLLRQVPRPRWNALRGALALSPSTEVKARYAEYEKDSLRRDVKNLLARFGPPNLFLETAPGEGTLYYFWLTGSYFKFTIAGGMVQSHERAYYHEPQ